MLILRLIAPLVLALLTWWGLRHLKSRYSLTTSQFRWLTGIAALLLVVLVLIVMGRLPVQALLAPVIFLLSFLLRNVHLLMRLLPLFLMGRRRSGSAGWGRQRASSAGGNSSIRTDWLDMSLDHSTGLMDGTVLQGRYQGQLLSALEMAALLQLADECRQDADSLQLLEAYLDRMHADWRESSQADSHTERAAPADAAMTEALALEILGLEPGASREEITAAHRRLMQKMHPDRGGSDYLAQRINAARDILLGY